MPDSKLWCTGSVSLQREAEQTPPDADPSDWWTSAYASAFSLERLRTPDNDMRLLNICIAAAGAVYSPAELYMAMGMQPLKLAPQHQVASWL